MKKLILILLISVLWGCSSNTQSTIQKSPTEIYASKLVDQLDLQQMEMVKKRVVKGLFFQGDDVDVEATIYLSKQEGNLAMVGVFHGSDLETIQEYMHTYLSDTKTKYQFIYPTEVFLLSNPIEYMNQDYYFMIVCKDIEKAQQLVKKVME